MKKVDTKHPDLEAIEKAHEFCEKWIDAPVYIMEDGAICVNGDVDLTGVPSLMGAEITELPVQFCFVTGDFNCASWNEENSDPDGPLLELTTLKGSPYMVGGSFICESNPLTSLEGGPQYVLGSYDCQFTLIHSLEGAPKFVGGNFLVPTDELVDEYVPLSITSFEGGMIESPFGVERISDSDDFKNVGKRKELGQVVYAEQVCESLQDFMEQQISEWDQEAEAEADAIIQQAIDEANAGVSIH